MNAPVNVRDDQRWAALAMIGASTVVYWIYSSMQLRRDRQRGLIRPPYAPYTMTETIREISGPNLIDFFKKSVRALETSIFQVNLPLPNVYVVGKASQQREIYQDKGTDKPAAFYQAFDMILGNPSMVSRSIADPRWRDIRKAMSPAFSSTEIARMNRICHKYVREWIDEAVEKSLVDDPEHTFDPSHAMTKLTFKTICEAAFEYEATDEECASFQANVDAALREFTFRQTTNPLRKVFGMFIPTVREAHACAATLVEFGHKVLETYRASPTKSTSKTLIRLIEDNSCDMTEVEKQTEVPQFLVAGMDTTGHLLSCILVHLARHPEQMTKARESQWRELIANQQEKKKKDEGKPQRLFETIRPSGYLHQVITESSRFLPVASVGSIRRTSREFTFSTREAATMFTGKPATKEVGGGEGEGKDTKFVIPRGSSVFLPQCLAHSDPSVFEDPDEFRPERWDNPTKEMTQSIVTFALGNRNCIGQSLANAELMTVLSILLMKYEFEVVELGELQYFLTVKYVGCRLRIKRAPVPEFAKAYEDMLFDSE